MKTQIAECSRPEIPLSEVDQALADLRERIRYAEQRLDLLTDRLVPVSASYPVEKVSSEPIPTSCPITEDISNCAAQVTDLTVRLTDLIERLRI